MDTIIIGAGVAGCVTARHLAEEGQRKVLVLEQREHIGGNCYDEKDEYGILIHKYGPHIFHTGNQRVYDYFSRFTEWYSFRHQVVANVHGRMLPVPFNLNTLELVYGEAKSKELEQKLIDAYGEGSRISIGKMMEHQDAEIHEIAQYVYENVFLHYTMKQWGQTPEEIAPEVTARVPVVISRDNGYFSDKYQGVPAEGFTNMFQKMLSHPNIEVQTGIDAREVIQLKEGTIWYKGEKFTGDVIYTGPVDELFSCCYGRLPYRSLRFEMEHFNQKDFQGHSVVNYTVSEDYTRITEYVHLTGQKADSTTIMKEYPFAYSGKPGEIPYYAILNPENQKIYDAYKELVKTYKGLYLIGRLAEYKYYNIDAMAEQAICLAEKLEGERV